MAALRLPRLIAFDLEHSPTLLMDFALGSLDTHVRGPVRRKGDSLNLIYDRDNQRISFYSDVPDLLAWLNQQTDVHVAACSRTHAPELARQALDQLLIATPDSATPKRAIELFQTLEIYPGSKLKHFRELHRKTGIPYSEMLFFDEVEQLGVTFVLVRKGTTRKLFDDALISPTYRALRLSLCTMLRPLSAMMPELRLTADDLTNSAPPAMHFGRRLGRSAMRRTEVSYPVPRATTPLRTTRGSRRLVRGAQRLAALKALHFNLAVGAVEGADWIDIVVGECDGSPDSDDQPLAQLTAGLLGGIDSESADRFCFERGIKAALGYVYAAANLQLASAGAILYSHSSAVAIVCASSATSATVSDFATTQAHTWSVFVPSETAWHTFRSASATVRYLVERATHESGAPIPHYRYRVFWPSQSIARQRRYEHDQPLPLYSPASSAPAVMQSFDTADDPPPAYETLSLTSAPIAIRTSAAHPCVSLASHSPTSPVLSRSASSWSETSSSTSVSTTFSRVLAASSSAPRSSPSTSAAPSSPPSAARRIVFSRRPVAPRSAHVASGLSAMVKAHDSDSDADNDC